MYCLTRIQGRRSDPAAVRSDGEDDRCGCGCAKHGGIPGRKARDVRIRFRPEKADGLRAGVASDAGSVRTGRLRGRCRARVVEFSD